MGALDIAAVQRELKAAGLDGWLFYSFRGSDPVAARILKLPDAHLTRRWFYYIPVTGKPTKLLHRIELHALQNLPGETQVYLGWRELEEKLKGLLPGRGTIAMQYSPENAIPYISRVDAGTVELIRAFGVKVVTSADLVSTFESVLTDAQRETHMTAVANLRKIVFEAFAEIRSAIAANKKINEYEIQQFIWNRYANYGMISDSPCIVAVNENSGSPHYQPSEQVHSEIKEGDFVLLDMWAKLKEPGDAVYGDITWTGYIGERVPERYARIFEIVAGGRDAAVTYIREAMKAGRPIQGWQVDDACRNYIRERGYGKDFVHRTGHSIGTEVHGNGANIDNLETQDKRRLLANTCFSIEPGIYLPEFGIRSEIDAYLTDDDILIGGMPIQTEVIPIMAPAGVRT